MRSRPMPGVDRRRRQRIQRAVGLPLELHEHVVPDLDVAIAAALDAAAGRPRRRESRCRGRSRSPSSARTGRCRPSPRSCRRRRARRCARPARAAPDLERLVVARNAGLALEDGREEAIGRQLPDLGQQLPRERDRVLLEVVAEREVAEHLEERVMPQRGADVVEVVVLAADAHALLRGRRARVVRAFSLPRKTSLNWFIPALVNSSVGSSCGTSGELGTTVWPFCRKYSRKLLRISRERIPLIVADGLGGALGWLRPGAPAAACGGR